MAATGKIARLPPQLREQVNRRLHEGQTDQTIADWLNTLPAVQQVMKDRFAAEPVSQQNVNNWRNGEHQKWLEEEKQLTRTRTLAEFSVQLAEAAGGGLAQGALAIAAGKILDRLHNLKEDAPLNEVVLLAGTANALGAGELAGKKLTLDERKAEQKDAELALKERHFQLRYVEKFILHAADEEAHRIATSTLPAQVKTDQLLLRLFGAPPAPKS